MSGFSPIFLMFVAFFAVAFVAIVVLAKNQTKAKMEKFWAPLIPVVNGRVEKSVLLGNYNNFPARMETQINQTEDSADQTLTCHLSLQNVVGKSDWSLSYGSEKLGFGEWKWRLKSRDAVLVQQLEQRFLIATVEKSLPQCLAQTPEKMLDELAQTQQNRGQARAATVLPPENSPSESSWSSSSSASSTEEKPIFSISPQTQNLLQNMGRWAMYPKIAFDARRQTLSYEAKVSFENGMPPEQFQAQLDLLIQLAEINRVRNV